MILSIIMSTTLYLKKRNYYWTYTFLFYVIQSIRYIVSQDQLIYQCILGILPFFGLENYRKRFDNDNVLNSKYKFLTKYGTDPDPIYLFEEFKKIYLKDKV